MFKIKKVDIDMFLSLYQNTGGYPMKVPRRRLKLIYKLIYI